ncbi:MAG: hypothetical protein CVT49_12925 [candidate division Zixibacteria bacterium HGW-Zixibacteria-1]|nr:MAG: hypothetical protein CVT49_12925 [candidate division Zixibacteria bacterium HGW-Zixibacteria-1]
MSTRPLTSRASIAILVLLANVLSTNTEAGEVSQSIQDFTSLAWESSQRMFYADPYWRGGDCASSVDLGEGRVLWLFADSYIGVKPPYNRDYCCVKMIRNCLGIQEGYDPSTADFTVFWRGTRDTPGAFFPGDDTSWYWPGNAVRLDSFLVVFLMHVCPSDSGLDFRPCEHSTHAAFLVSDLDGDPGEWTISPLKLPENKYGMMLGAATLIELPYLYMFGVKEPGDHTMYLARWHVDSVVTGSTSAIQWWTGQKSTWVLNSELASEPLMVFPEGATELSVVIDTLTDQYLAIQTVGFGPADIMMRTALAITGPWSDLRLVYEPPEKVMPGIMIYAAKAHPEIVGADIIITYNTNAPIEMIISDTTIYYPRFLRLDWRE